MRRLRNTRQNTRAKHTTSATKCARRHSTRIQLDTPVAKRSLRVILNILGLERLGLQRSDKSNAFSYLGRCFTGLYQRVLMRILESKAVEGVENENSAKVSDGRA